MEKLKYNFTWKKYHRWFGLVLSVFMLVFCVSGIILNHREAFSGCEVSRKWLPSSYHIKNFNNGILKGTVQKNSAAQSFSAEHTDSVLVYGCAGIFLTDSQLSTWQDFNAGLPESIDERNVRQLVKAKDGSLWCAALRDVYRYDEKSKRWKKVELPNNEERIMDVALAKDSLQVVALTRSCVYTISQPSASTHARPEINDTFGYALKQCVTKKHLLKVPVGYEPKTTLFKIVWHLHSGEFFGLPGKLVVDAIALVLIVLSITGIVLFILPYGMRRAKKVKSEERRAWEVENEGRRVKNSLAAKARMKRLGKRFAWNMKWHNKTGYVTIVLTLWIAITGMCLRPPLMVPLVLGKIPQAVGEDGNVWNDKLRAIRWDATHGDWLVSTSDGFLRVDENFSQAPKILPADECPKLSPMGVTVWESDGKGGWIVGSFRGIYRWVPTESSSESDKASHSVSGKTSLSNQKSILSQKGEKYQVREGDRYQVLDYFTNKPSEETSMIPISDNLVCGYSEDFFGGKLVFDFAKGVEDAKGKAVEIVTKRASSSDKQDSMSDLICDIAPMSLWNVALELHVGRCYSPFLGPLSDLFVFLSGLLITLVLLSGYIISHRRKKKAKARKRA